MLQRFWSQAPSFASQHCNSILAHCRMRNFLMKPYTLSPALIFQSFFPVSNYLNPFILSTCLCLFVCLFLHRQNNAQEWDPVVTSSLKSVWNSCLLHGSPCFFFQLPEYRAKPDSPFVSHDRLFYSHPNPGTLSLSGPFTLPLLELWASPAMWPLRSLIYLHYVLLIFTLSHSVLLTFYTQMCIPWWEEVYECCNRHVTNRHTPSLLHRFNI